MALRERRTRRGRPMARHEAQLQHTVGMLVFALTLPVFAFLSLPLLAPVCAVCAVLAAGTAVLCMGALMVLVHAITSQGNDRSCPMALHLTATLVGGVCCFRVVSWCCDGTAFAFMCMIRVWLQVFVRVGTSSPLPCRTHPNVRWARVRNLHLEISRHAAVESESETIRKSKRKPRRKDKLAIALWTWHFRQIAVRMHRLAVRDRIKRRMSRFVPVAPPACAVPAILSSLLRDATCLCRVIAAHAKIVFICILLLLATPVSAVPPATVTGVVSNSAAALVSALETVGLVGMLPAAIVVPVFRADEMKAFSLAQMRQFTDALNHPNALLFSVEGVDHELPVGIREILHARLAHSQVELLSADALRTLLEDDLLRLRLSSLQRFSSQPLEGV